MANSEVILGLGSNVGNRREQLAAAIGLLGQYIDNIHLSSIYQAKALLPDGAPEEWNIPFYNMVISGRTFLSPQELLLAIKKTEQDMGRNKIGHWSPREIDIDILGMGDAVIDSPELSIPHKELLKRNFAMLPLAEVAADWRHPIVQQTAKELAQNFTWDGLKLLKKPKLVGIINVTPDSFSDGGINFDAKIALENIYNLIADGADVIDIGAESTRPNATSIYHAEEWARLEPVLLALRGVSVLISIDTRHAETAKKALSIGADWINDVSGFSEPEMLAAVRGSSCKLVVMHSLSVPADKNVILPLGSDPLELLVEWAEKRFAELEKAGISRDRIIFDPGIGFGKNAQQSLAIIKDINRLKVLGVPLFVGHSRKSFLGYNAGDDETIKISQQLADSGVDYLRVHNVRRHKLEIL